MPFSQQIARKMLDEDVLAAGGTSGGEKRFLCSALRGKDRRRIADVECIVHGTLDVRHILCERLGQVKGRRRDVKAARKLLRRTAKQLVR